MGQTLDCYWVGSVGFNFSGNQGGFPLNPQKVKLFAGGSTATKKQISPRFSRARPVRGGRASIGSRSASLLLYLSRTGVGQQCGLKMAKALANGSDSNLRSMSWWFNFDGSKPGSPSCPETKKSGSD